MTREVVAAGAAGVVIDWERRGKRRRQAGHDTQVNADTSADLRRVRRALPAGGRLLCRVNRWAAWSAREIDTAVGLGADEVLLPMVRRPSEVDQALNAVAGRCELGILVETGDAVGEVEALVRRPVARVYVGLNDLMIDRGGTWLFEPLVDGTVDRVAKAAAGAGVPFGVAGLTLPDRGHPVPARLLAAALARAGASFTFLRRSFLADVAGLDLAVEVPRIHAAVAEAETREAAAVAADHAVLAGWPVAGVRAAPATQASRGVPAAQAV